MFGMSKLLLATFTAGLALVPTLACAETKQVTVPRGKVSGVVSLGAYDRVMCGVYPIHNVRIATMPTHGAAQVIDHVTALGKDTGLCAGKSFKAPVVIYKPTGNYTGPDSLTVKWMAPKNTEAVSEIEQTLYMEITVR